VLAWRGGVGEVLIWNGASNMHMLLGHVMYLSQKQTYRVSDATAEGLDTA